MDCSDPSLISFPFKVFKQWRAERVRQKEEKLQKEMADRVKKGVLNGREIFMQSGTCTNICSSSSSFISQILGFVAADDASASVSYAREVDVEEEITKMEADTRRREEESRTLSQQSHITSLFFSHSISSRFRPRGT